LMRHTPHHLVGRGEETLAYFLVLDALNFGSAFMPDLAPYRGERDYFALAASVRDWFVSEGVPTAAMLRAVDADTMRARMAQDPNNRALDLLFTWQAQALHELATFLDDVLVGRYANLLTLSQRRADAIVDLLTRMPMFRDVATLDGRDVPILKRAQILVHDLAIAATDDAFCAIDGLEDLTAFADNMLPFVLEAHGVLRYDPALAARIRTGELTAGERVEVELRAASIVACERLAAILGVGVREVDYALWNAGVALEHTIATRPHICRTIYY